MSKSEKSSNEQSRHWFGHNQVKLTGDDAEEVVIVVGATGKWTKEHIDKLKLVSNSAGITPILDVDFTDGGQPYAATPVLADPNFAETLKDDSVTWQDKAQAISVIADIMSHSHEIDLVHGGLAPEQISVRDEEIMINSLGLGLGGKAPEEASEWIATEVLEGQEATKYSDIFSLGAMLGAALETASPKPRALSRLAKWATSETPETRPPSMADFSKVISDTIESDANYRPGYVATGGYLSIIEASATDDVIKTSDNKKNDISFADLRSEQEQRRKSALAPVASVETDQEILATESDRNYGWLAAATIVGLGILLSYWIFDSTDSSDTATPDSTDLSSPTIEETPDDDSELNPKSPVLATNPSIDINDAGLQIVHGIANTDVDVYLDGELAIKEFKPGTLAGPAATDNGDYEITVFAASDNPALSLDDRSDSPLISETVSYSGDPTALIAFTNSEGEPSLDRLELDTEALDAGAAKLAIANYSDSPSVTVEIGDEVFALGSGEAKSIDAEAAAAEIKVTGEASALDQTVDLADGELANIYIFDAGADDELALSEVRLRGLATAPQSVPTGNSGLAQQTNSTGYLAVLAFVCMGLTGLVIRRRYGDA